MSSAADQLWEVAQARQHVDADALAIAIEQAVRSDGQLDFRTRLLLRESVAALEQQWGAQRFATWLNSTGRSREIESICNSAITDDADGFPSLKRRIVEATKPETVLEFFRELSLHVQTPTKLLIGGSIALMLNRHLSRHTEDIDLVDEVPAEIRAQHALLDELSRRFGLQLTRFQSHYLPSGWESRLQSIGTFGELHVFAVDAYDIFLSKLFSQREKDRDDLRALARTLDRRTIEQRLAQTTTKLRAEPQLEAAAQQNWFIVYGDASLPA